MELGGPGSQYLSLGLIHNLFTGLSAPTPIVSSPHSSLKDPFNVSHRSELSYGSWTQSVKSKVLVVACEAPRLPFLAPVTALISFSFPFPSHHSTVATLASVLLAEYPDTALGPLPCCRCLRQMANSLPSLGLCSGVIFSMGLPWWPVWPFIRPCCHLYSQCLLLCSDFSPVEGNI